jgi:hypothetical protein
MNQRFSANLPIADLPSTNSIRASVFRIAILGQNVF